MHDFAPPDLERVAEEVARALAEDLGQGDVSTDLVADRPAQARIVCREDAVLCGGAWVEAAFRALDPAAVISWHYRDGGRVGPGATVCEIAARSRALLSAERTALNFLQMLSATASETARYAAALSGTGTRLLDTRKTLPGLRHAQKYAVRCGGGINHRIGLFDAVMLKENHIAAAGSISAAMQAARARHPGLPLIVEVETLDELDQVLSAGGCTRVLIDDFDAAQREEAVRRCRGRQALEVSGGVSLESLADIARSGVDFVSVGGITKHIRAVDFSLRIIEGA
ncbi:carboxylating nicotinate-nucleotide diphosphorylase [Lysobacter sp. CAU 1642]|uniref:nicotinate-nucleotide diphosphorylase (carboxylating) n=1 Tax=Pseudomarimonas salicorniae TaxID=2933270 RepID=A0ABT0GJ06_9GAMM|nr:carboxylating nicotinate-nucleotide diphosphorylase [Lysobacter sp. CAU 1642]